MNDTTPPPVTVVPPDATDQPLGPGFGVSFKLDGTHTGGAFSIVEHPFEVGAMVPPHQHTREDEYSIVTEGEIGFRSGDREVVLGHGGYIAKPRGELHAMWNAGRTPARMIEIISPAGFEEYFRGLGELLADGPPAFDDVARLAGSFGLVFDEAPWLPDVIERYRLTPPPG
ncbi:MAG: cupin domain-containing protein [Propionibacteriales bacterium]|nr:cupin domain-containing protein [Propionibacteriales bacterium]